MFIDSKNCSFGTLIDKYHMYNVHMYEKNDQVNPYSHAYISKELDCIRNQKVLKLVLLSEKVRKFSEKNE